MTGNRGVQRYVARGIRVNGKYGGKEATEARLVTCQHGLGSYKLRRAVRPVNAPLLMTVIRLLFKYLWKGGMS